MSYLVLARKYRPQNFDEVVGQESAATALRNAIEQNRVGQAFLFAGPRGVGKTSMARILAKALNCEKGPTADPCGKCEICKGVESGRDVDVQEIDAATYSKVENIRDLRETIPYGTLRARFKVLIVDEVHRLSAAAFDALLKVLEEPPPHVKFIFATTEMRKVPETIVSRCQFFEFRRIEEDDIVKALASVAKKEKVKAEEDLFRAIARASKGGMRDSLTQLDQLIAFAGNAPTLEDLEKCSGMAQEDSFFFLLEKIHAADRKAILEKLDSLFEQGVAEEEFLNQWIDFVRQLLIVRSCGEKTPLFLSSGENKKKFLALAENFSVERIDRMLTIAIAAREKANYISGHARAIAELALMKTTRLGEEIPSAELVERLLALEKQGVIPATATPAPMPETRTSFKPPAPADYVIDRKKMMPDPAPQKASTPAPTVLSPAELWSGLLSGLREERKSFVDVLSRKGRPVGLTGNRYEVAVAEPTAIEKTILQDQKNIEAAGKFLTRARGEMISFALRFQKAAEAQAIVNKENTGPMAQKALEMFEGRIVND